MNQTCRHCGEGVPEGATVCPKCKTPDPLARVMDEAERFREEQVESGSRTPKK